MSITLNETIDDKNTAIDLIKRIVRSFNINLIADLSENKILGNNVSTFIGMASWNDFDKFKFKGPQYQGWNYFTQNNKERKNIMYALWTKVEVDKGWTTSWSQPYFFQPMIIYKITES